MPAGIIKGALARMGFQTTVIPEIVQLPQCELPSRIVYIVDPHFMLQVHSK